MCDVFLRDPLPWVGPTSRIGLISVAYLSTVDPIAVDPHDSDLDDSVTHEGQQGLLSATAFRACPTTA
jgi:hypothetical protein